MSFVLKFYINIEPELLIICIYASKGSTSTVPFRISASKLGGAYTDYYNTLNVKLLIENESFLNLAAAMSISFLKKGENAFACPDFLGHLIAKEN